MRNRHVVAGEVVAIEAVDPTGARVVLAIDRADLPVVDAEGGWTVRADGRAISTAGRLLHRVVLGLAGRADRGTLVRHRNDRLHDCRRWNLATTTPSRVACAAAPLPSTGVRHVRHDPAYPPKPYRVRLRAGGCDHGHRWATLGEGAAEAAVLAARFGRG